MKQQKSNQNCTKDQQVEGKKLSEQTIDAVLPKDVPDVYVFMLKAGKYQRGLFK